MSQNVIYQDGGAQIFFTPPPAPPPFLPSEPDTSDYATYAARKYGISLRAQGEVWQNVFPLYFGDAIILMGQAWM